MRRDNAIFHLNCHRRCLLDDRVATDDQTIVWKNLEVGRLVPFVDRTEVDPIILGLFCRK